jgi:dATP pyrophosphohydrolase
MNAAAFNSAPEYRRPLSVLVVVYTTAGDVLLLRRSRPFDFWQSVTGSLQPCESHAEAAQRELREETGLQGCDLCFSGHERVFTIDPRWRHRYAPDVSENTEFEWRCALVGRRPIGLSGREHSEYCWLPFEQAIDRVWSWTNRDALTTLRDELREKA